MRGGGKRIPKIKRVGEGKLRYQTFLVMQPLTVPSPYEKCRGQVMLTTYKKQKIEKETMLAA